MSDNLTGLRNAELNRVESADDGPSFAADGPTISTETIFEVLADRHCRAVLSYMENSREHSTSVSDLADSVGQHTATGTPPSQIAVQLHHAHLPRLDEAGLLSYDRGGDTVQYVGHPLVEACLSFFEDE